VFEDVFLPQRRSGLAGEKAAQLRHHEFLSFMPLRSDPDRVAIDMGRIGAGFCVPPDIGPKAMNNSFPEPGFLSPSIELRRAAASR